MCARTDLEPVTEQDRRRELLLRMRILRKQQEEPPPTPESDVPLDTLAVVTAHHRRLIEGFYKKVEKIRRHPTVSVLLRSTQPAHLVMVLAVLVVSSSILQLSSSRPASPFTNLVYLAAFSIHLGNQFWMTFVSGLALYFNLPRHDFGAVQKVLFPKYFSINSCLSLITLISFTKLHQLTSMKTPEIVQVAMLSTCFLIELMTRLYVVPTVIRLITEKTELETAAGVGREVGHFNPGALLACPFYKRKHIQFRRLHTLVAVGNIVAMGCTSLHLYYLSLHWTCHIS